jgi:hypothetical protein
METEVLFSRYSSCYYNDFRSVSSKMGFGPYLASHCSGVTETSHLVLPTHELQRLKDWSKLVDNEQHNMQYFLIR